MTNPRKETLRQALARIDRKAREGAKQIAALDPRWNIAIAEMALEYIPFGLPRV